MTVAVLAKDESNFTVTESAALLEQWKAAGVELLIVQCFPPSYASKYANQIAQMQLAQQAGIPFDGYIYDYLADPSWRDGCLQGLQALVGQGLVCRRLWADEEDVSSSTQSMSVPARVRAISVSLKAIDLAPTKINPTGVYTGAWWWKPYTSNSSAFSDRPLWLANYDGNPDTSVGYVPLGGWPYVTTKQYAGSQPDGTDLDVLSAIEAGLLNSQPEVQNVAIVVGQGMQAQMTAAGDAPLFGHKFFSEVDDQGNTYSVEQCYGAKGMYVSANSSGNWVNAGPIA
jgi:hypothetical protein